MEVSNLLKFDNSFYRFGATGRTEFKKNVDWPGPGDTELL